MTGFVPVLVLGFRFGEFKRFGFRDNDACHAREGLTPNVEMRRVTYVNKAKSPKTLGLFHERALQKHSWYAFCEMYQ